VILLTLKVALGFGVLPQEHGLLLRIDDATIPFRRNVEEPIFNESSMLLQHAFRSKGNLTVANIAAKGAETFENSATTRLSIKLDDFRGRVNLNRRVKSVLPPSHFRFPVNPFNVPKDGLNLSISVARVLSKELPIEVHGLQDLFVDVNAVMSVRGGI